jgi:hypothetical protein
MSKIFEALRKAESSRAPQRRTTVSSEGLVNGNDRRRSPRHVFDAVLLAYGRGSGMRPFYEETSTVNVSVHGALLLMTVPVEKGEKLLLINEVTQRQQICRIVDTRTRDSQQLEVAVEFPAPDGEFWQDPPSLDEKQPSAENRRYERITLPNGILVVWKNSRERVISRSDSLSMGGLFVNTPDPPEEGDIIDLCFGVPNGDVRARGIGPPFAEGQRHGR